MKASKQRLIILALSGLWACPAIANLRVLAGIMGPFA